MSQPRFGYLLARMAELSRPETRATGEPLAAWAERRIRLEGKPFTFRGHEYLRAIYNDTAQRVVLVKASQVGGSVYAILRAIHACLSGLNTIYFFPTRTDVIEFSKSRIGPLIETNAFLRKMVRDTDTAGLKKIGDAHLHLRGMQSAVQMKSVPADVLVFDELDEAPPESKTLALERLAHSDYKRMIELSNPSLPDYGIDAAFGESDQRHWFCRCTGCGAWVSPVAAFPKKLGQEVRIIRPRGDGAYYRACPKCAAELDIEDGEWVPEFPGSPVHGYLISQLFSSRVDPAEIIREYRKTRFPERFFNLKVGIPWADTRQRVSASSVLALCRDYTMSETESRCTMGVDTGRTLHVVISQRVGEDRHRIVYLGEHRDFSELDELMQRFDVFLCVIDALPETHSTREFANRQWGSVFLNYFNEAQRGSTKWDWSEHIVQENRTEVLDASRRVLREGLVELPRRSPIVETFAAHNAALAKRLEVDEETGRERYTYVRSGPDHFALAFTYNVIAWERDDPRIYELGWA